MQGCNGKHHSTNDPGEQWIIRKEYTRVRSVANIDPDSSVTRLCREMKAYAEWCKKFPPDPFFHRKSSRAVLAVLHVEIDGVSHYVRGINSEVSLPTGAVCAERASVVKARSEFAARREHMKGIAVLEVPLSEAHEDVVLSNPLPPCGACREWLEKIQEVSSGFYVLTFPELSLDTVHERFMFWSEEEDLSQPSDLGPWTCRLCGTANVPMSRKCRQCEVSRFSMTYNRVPTEQHFFDVLDVLRTGERSMEAIHNKLLSTKCSVASEKLAKILKRLSKAVHKDDAGGVYGRLITKNTSGSYHITETGLQILGQWQSQKRGRRQPPA